MGDTMLVLQLGVLSTYAGDNLQGLYHYLCSLAVHAPFSTARANAKMIFDKVLTRCANLKHASFSSLPSSSNNA